MWIDKLKSFSEGYRKIVLFVTLSKLSAVLANLNTNRDNSQLFVKMRPNKLYFEQGHTKVRSGDVFPQLIV